MFFFKWLIFKKFQPLYSTFILQMIAKGKNASDLFPAVVKNVASKNIEVLFWFIIFMIPFVVKESYTFELLWNTTYYKILVTLDFRYNYNVHNLK